MEWAAKSNVCDMRTLRLPTLDKYEVKVLNAQAALVDAVWVRRDTAGAVSRALVSFISGSNSARLAHHVGSQHIGINAIGWRG